MPIMRGPSGARKTFKIPCSGEGIFLVINNSLNAAAAGYWNGTSMTALTHSSFFIRDIIVQDGIATVTVLDDTGSSSLPARACFIPGNPLASN